MKAVLIGSAAHADDPNDYDVLADQEWAEKLWSDTGDVVRSHESTDQGDYYAHNMCGTVIDVKVPKPDTAHALVLDNYHNWPIRIYGTPVGNLSCAPLPILAALKKAHLILPHRWNAQIRRYAELKALLNVDVFDPWSSAWGQMTHEVYALHREECLAKAKKHPKLAQGKKAFFGDESYEIFDHDSIHEALAYPRQPAYVQIKGETAEVYCSKAKWEALDEIERMRCVKEEASILALERSILPALFQNKEYRGAAWAYARALMGIGTTITSGWFRDYAIERYDQAVRERPDFVAAFFAGVKSGVVKCLKPEVLTK